LFRAQDIYNDIDPTLEKKFVKKFIKGLRDEQVKIDLLKTSSIMRYRSAKNTLKGICRARANSFDSDEIIQRLKERKKIEIQQLAINRVNQQVLEKK
jgi:hypothetical protein